MTPPTALILIFVELAIVISARSTLLQPVATPNEIPECLHLSVEEEGQYNYFDGKHGGRCCMCRLGTRVARECKPNAPNSTICEDCQYDEEKQTYVDFEPHMQTQCNEDTLECFQHQIKIPGSPSSPSKCVCANGTEPVAHGYWCEPVADSGSTAPSVNVPTAEKKEPHTETAKPSDKETVAVMTTPFKVTKPELDVTDQDKGSDTDVTSPASNVESTTSMAKITTWNDTVVVHSKPPTPFNTVNQWISISFAVIICGIVAFLVWLFRGQIQRMLSSCREDGGTCWFTKEVHPLNNGECEQILVVRDKEKPADFEVSAFSKTEKSLLLNPCDQMEQDSEVQPQAPAQPVDDVDQAEAHLTEDHHQVSRQKHTDSASFVEFSHTEGSVPWNSAGPIEEGNQVQVEVHAQLQNDVNHPDLPALLMNNIAQPEAPVIEYHCQVSQKEKDLRYDACMEMADEISERDLSRVGRKFLKAREFEDIYDDKTIPIRAEKARRIFLRAIELRPDLILKDLRDAVASLGYLCEIVDSKIAVLRGNVA